MKSYKTPYLVPSIISIILIVIFDLASKKITFDFLSSKPGSMLEITSFFNLVTVWNRGVSFGIFQNLSYGPIILSVTALIIACYLFFLLLGETNKMLTIALVMIIGGALGNSIDRIMNGAVADFLDVHIGYYHWPAFNVADSFITCGVILYIIIDLFFGKKKDDQNTDK